MDRIVACDKVAGSRINTSIAKLDEFLESQLASLRILTDGIGVIEKLKRQASVEPTVVEDTIMNNRVQGLKFSEACLELDMKPPDLDWSLVGTTETRAPTDDSTGTTPSRIDRVRSHIAELHQTLAALPALPPSLLDNDPQVTEAKAQKRRRLEPITRNALSVPSSSLRLPCPIIHHDPTTLTSPVTSRQSQESRFTSIPSPSSSAPHEAGSVSTPLDAVSHLYLDYSYPERPPWTSKSVSTVPPIRARSSSPTSSAIHEPESLQTDGNTEQPFESGEQDRGPSTFKQNWTLAEQHMLEQLLVEIPSTVKFRWVRISEAMGGTRTPRQVASRVQKYYQKMKKLGVAIDSADMGGGGRGGSKAIHDLDLSSPVRGRGSSTRGKPKTGPQYTKSGRRR